MSTVIDPFDSIDFQRDDPLRAPGAPSLGVIEREAMETAGRMNKITKRLSLHRKPDGTILEGKAARAAGKIGKAGKAIMAKSAKKARKKLRKAITDEKRARLIEKAKAIVDPQERAARVAFIAKRASKAAKPKLPNDARAVYQEQLFDPDPRRRDEAWMALTGTGIPEEAQ